MKKFQVLFALAVLYSNYCTAQVPDYVSQSNLVGWWPLHNNLIDSSSNSYDGSGANYSFTIDRFGSPFNACDFTSNNTSYIQFSNLANAIGPYSINYWVKLNTYQNLDVLLDFHPGAQCATFPQHWESDDSLFVVECNNVPTKRSLGHKDDFIWYWRMVTHMATADTTYIYVDGILKFAFPFSWGTAPDYNMIVGNNYNSVNAYNKGANATVDDIGFWSGILEQCEISKLFHAANTLITQHPVNATTMAGNSASFSISDTGGAATYQWQENDGSGFVNLTNTPPYGGVNTKVLTINPATTSLNNNTYRCIRNAGTCVDTSNAAMLTVNPTGISVIYNVDEVQVVPNPAKGIVTVTAPLEIKKMQLTNALGQVVLVQEANACKATINLSDFAPGIYMLKINNVYIKKILKQE